MGIRANRLVKKGVFRSLFYSYIPMLLLPLFISCGVFGLSLRATEQQLHQINDASVGQMRSIIDGYLREVNDMNRLLLANTGTQSLLYHKGPFAQQKLVQLRQLQNDIIRLMSASKLVSSVYLYFDASDAILSNANLFYGDSFARQCESSLWMTYEQWQEAIRFEGYRRYLLQSRASVNGGTEYKLLVLQKNTPTAEGQTGDLVIGVVLDCSAILSIMDELSHDNRYQALVLDTENRLALGSGALFPFDSYRELLEEPAYPSLFSLFLGRSPVFTSERSAVNGWLYVFVIPAQEYLGPARLMLFAMGGYFALWLVGGALLAIYQARRQYTPLQRLVDQIQAKVEGGAAQSGNEYDHIEHTLAGLLEQKKASDQRLLQNRNILRENTLRNLLRGRISKGETVKSLEERSGIAALSGAHLVLVYSPEEISRYSLEESAGDEEALEFIYALISSVAEEAARGAGDIYPVEINDSIACLLCLARQEDEAGCQEAALQIARRSRDFLEQRLEVPLSIGVSNLHRGVEGIARAFSEGAEAAEYASVLGIGERIVSYESLAGTGGELELSEIIDRERMFLNCMKAEDYAGARTQIDSIIRQYFHSGTCSLQQAKLRLSGLVNAAVTALAEVRPQVGEEFFRELNPIDKLYDSKNVTGLAQAVQTIFTRLIEITDGRKRAVTGGRSQRILTYVHENFHNPDLNVNTISEEFDITPSYLSGLVRQATGTGLPELIHRLRIEEAKAMMQRNPSVTVKEVAATVGYGNSLTMVRAFRRYEGVTPGMFKDKLHGQV